MRRPSIVPALAVVLVLAAPARADPPPSMTVAEALQTLHRVIRLHEVAIAPDGVRVAWVEQVATPDGPAPDRSIIQVLDRVRPGRAPVRVTARGDAAHDEREPTFSPDGGRLAFLSDAEKKGQLQLYVVDLAGGKVTQLTHVTGHLGHPTFSPDGNRIAVLFLEGDAAAAGPLGPASRQSGEVDRQIREQRVLIVPAAGGAARAVSPASLFVYEYAWRPDGNALAAVAAPGSGDDNWWNAELHVFDLASGADRVVHHPKLQICQPTYSPDGKRIAFIEGLMSDAGANGGDVYVVPEAGGAAKNLTPGMRGSAASLSWLRPDEILFSLRIEGDAAFATVPAAGGKVSVRWRDAANITRDWVVGAAFSRDGSVSAGVRDAFDRPPEVVAGPLGKWQPLTRRNAAVVSPAGPARSVTWKSGRWDVQGWLLAPRTLPAGAKAPMVVVVHGGPAGAMPDAWMETPLLLASQGYFVFLPNPRGSFGQGEAFTRANVKDFGHGDLRDILAGVDAVLKSAPVAADRLGIYGHSYGGYMTMWAVTQTHRFRAAVSSAGIANWQSYYGQNRIDQWMLPYFGKSVYEDPAVYARSSPINYIRNAKTPTLILYGERDAECPLPQGQEFWHALKTLGVDTALVVYPDEGHHLRDPAHRRDHAERMVRWFDRYLKKGSGGGRLDETR